MNHDRDLDHLNLLSIFHYIFAGLLAFGGCIGAIYLGGLLMVFGWIGEAVQEEAVRAEAEARLKAEAARVQEEQIQGDLEAAIRENDARAKQLHQAVEQEHGDEDHGHEPAENKLPLEAPRPGQEPGLPAVPAVDQDHGHDHDHEPGHGHDHEQPANAAQGLKPGGAEQLPEAQAAEHAQAEEHRPAAPELPPFFPKAVVGFMGAIFGAHLVLSFLGVVLLIMAGRKLTSHNSHTFCLVIAGLECLWVPMGTILGVFTLIVLLRPSVKVLFGVMDRSELRANGYDQDDDY